MRYRLPDNFPYRRVAIGLVCAVLLATAAGVWWLTTLNVRNATRANKGDHAKPHVICSAYLPALLTRPALPFFGIRLGLLCFHASAI